MTTYTDRVKTLSINDPAAYLFLCNAVRNESKEVRRTFYDSLRFGKRLGLVSPAGVVLASYSRWLENNDKANIENFFKDNTARSIFADIIDKMNMQKVIYPEVFNATPH